MKYSELGIGKRGLPVGCVYPCAWNDPDGLLCNGASVSRTEYDDLFAVIGTMYGSDDSASFKLPDYRDRHLRCVDGGAGVDPDAADRGDRGDGQDGDTVGTRQDGQIQSHYHRSSELSVVTNDYRLATHSGSAYGQGPSGGDGSTTPHAMKINYYIAY